VPSLVINNLPEEVHQKLKHQDQRHHRSMSKEAIAILSEGLGNNKTVELPAPYKTRFPLTDEFIDNAKREGRWNDDYKMRKKR
jgi:plasmid stability protein